MSAISSNRKFPGASALVRALAVGGLVACASAAMAGPAEKPFTASLDIVETVAFSNNAPCAGTGYLSGSGNATHLGKVKGVATDCINPQSISGNPADWSFFFSSTTVALTSASGDMLYLSYVGTLTDQAVGPHIVKGDFLITGGTGRFFGAVGRGVVTGTEDLSQFGNSVGKVTYTGTITY